MAEIVGRYLCQGCGTCVAVCPHGSLSLHMTDGGFTVTSDASCVGCGLCSSVCPALMPAGIAETTDVDDPAALIGDYRAAYIGFTRDDELRQRGTAGGIGTALLIHALENGFVDGAIVSRLDQSRFACESFIARDPDELVQAAGSKYCPSSTNELLREASAADGERLALVGLPCQIAGAAKASEVSRRFRGIEMLIGLFCSHSITRRGLPFILDRYAAGSQNLERVVYRAEGWPGHLVVEYTSGERITVPHETYWRELFGPYFFTPYGCLLCTDLAAERADISLADAWLPEIRSRDSVGTSMVVVRTERGAALMESLCTSGKISVARIEPADVIRSRTDSLARKKVGAAARHRLARMLGLIGRQAETTLPKVRSSSLLGAALAYMNAWISSTSIGRRLLAATPARVLRRYSTLVYRRSASV